MRFLEMRIGFNKIIRGFTLIEVLVAAVIFSLVVTALYTTYTTGLNSYERSQRNREMQQNARAVFDLVGKDLRSVYWRVATEYNVLSPQEEQKFKNLGFYDFDKEKGKEGKEDKEDEEDPFSNYEYLKYDLSFTGSLNSISFVRYQNSNVSYKREMMNLARVDYSLKDGNLVRSIKDTMSIESYDYYTGEKKEEKSEEETEEKSKVEDIVAKGIKEFSLKYLYFYDDAWHWTESWNSETNQYRNPSEEDEEGDEKSLIQSLSGEDPLKEMKKEKIIPDGLPSCVEVTIVVQNRTNEKILKKYQTVIDIPTSLETWVKKEDSVFEKLGSRVSKN